MKESVNNKNEAGAVRPWTWLLVTGLLLLGVATPTWAGKGNLDNPGVMAPQASAFGKTYSEWAMEFAKWNLSIPGPIHPSFDTTGELASVGQSGKVWFLCGGASAPLLGPPPATVERFCTIPAGTAIFLQIRGTFWATLPVDLDENGQPLITDEEAFAVLKEIEDTTTDLVCEIDGKPVHNLQNYRFQTPAFSYTFPDLAPGDIWWNYGWPEEDWLAPSGGWLSTPTIWDGYAVLLPPLSAGRHTIHHRSYNSSWGESQDVTYQVTVK